MKLERMTRGVEKKDRGGREGRREREGREREGARKGERRGEERRGEVKQQVERKEEKEMPRCINETPGLEGSGRREEAMRG